MKYSINVCETVNFNNKIYFETPIVDEDELDELLDNAEKGSYGLGDIQRNLEEQGCKINEIIQDEDGTPDEIEIDDYSILDD